MRKQAGLTQKTFSERISVSRSFLSEIESGKVKPSLETLVGVVMQFQVDAHWLLVGTGKGATADLAAEPSSGYQPTPERQSAYPLIPLLDDRVVQGPPRRLSKDEIIAYLPLWGPVAQKESYCFYLQDDAMAPFLRRGALVGMVPIAAPSKKWEGKLVALWQTKGGITLRRLRIDQKYFIFEAENKSHSVFYLERSAKPVLFGVEWWWQNQKELG
ncbi:MAG: XRE family transcriptional regulator [Nitrospirae bacterium]|nr:XRE family transcriptional regulator [Candidatus Manganitrophaceae bacterium]